MKRLASFVLASVLLFAIVPSVFASGGAPAPTKSPLVKAVEGKTFEEAKKALEALDSNENGGNGDGILDPTEIGTTGGNGSGTAFDFWMFIGFEQFES